MAKSLDDLEANPKSKGQAIVLAENVAAARLMSDAEVMQALTKLVDALKTEGINISGGTVQGNIIQNAKGGDMIFRAGDGAPGGSGGNLTIGPGIFKAGDGGKNNMTK